MASQVGTLEYTTPTAPGSQTQFAQGDINKVLSTTACGLSIMGALVIIITFVMWPDLRTNSRKIILFISIGDLFVAITNIVGVYGHSNFLTCKIEATLSIVAILSSFFWTVFLSVYFYVTICRKITLEKEARMMRFFHVTAWGIPLVLAAIALGDKAVGNLNDFVSSGWCWIKYNHHQEWWKVMLWMFLAGKGWEILAYVTICVFYVLVKLQIRREVRTIYSMKWQDRRGINTIKGLFSRREGYPSKWVRDRSGLYKQFSQVGLPYPPGQLYQLCWRVSSCMTFFSTVQNMIQMFTITLRNWIIPFKLAWLLVTHDIIQVGELSLAERLQGS